MQILFLRQASKKLIALAYHGIDDAFQFEKQMQFIAERMRPVSLQNVLTAISEDSALPEKSVLVTFDDGDVSLLDKGAPILKKYGIPAIAFVVAGVLDSTTPLWWNEVKELAKNGGSVSWLPGRTPENIVRELKKVEDDRRLAAIDELRRSANAPASPSRQLTRKELVLLNEAGIAVENHSLTHPCFPSCSPEKVNDEISQSHQILSESLNRPPAVFAFPNGDRDERAISVLRDHGYQAAFLFDHNVSNFPPENPFAISRVRVNSTTGISRFRTIISGLHPALHRLRGLK